MSRLVSVALLLSALLAAGLTTGCGTGGSGGVPRVVEGGDKMPPPVTHIPGVGGVKKATPGAN